MSQRERITDAIHARPLIITRAEIAGEDDHITADEDAVIETANELCDQVFDHSEALDIDISTDAMALAIISAALRQHRISVSLDDLRDTWEDVTGDTAPAKYDIGEVERKLITTLDLDLEPTISDRSLLRRELDRIEDAGDDLGLGPDAIQMAKVILRQAKNNLVLSGLGADNHAAAALILGARQQGIHVRVARAVEAYRRAADDDVGELFSEDTVMKAVNKTKDALGLKSPPTDPRDLVDSFGTDIDAPTPIIKIADRLVTEALDEHPALMSGRKPETIVTTAYYIGQIIAGAKTRYTQSELAEAADIASVQIRSFQNEVYDTLVPDDVTKDDVPRRLLPDDEDDIEDRHIQRAYLTVDDRFRVPVSDWFPAIIEEVGLPDTYEQSATRLLEDLSEDLVSQFTTGAVAAAILYIVSLANDTAEEYPQRQFTEATGITGVSIQQAYLQIVKEQTPADVSRDDVPQSVLDRLRKDEFSYLSGIDKDDLGPRIVTLLTNDRYHTDTA